ncbi:hypothetical protein Lal_00005965 [Lupinus albus]|nr:hypothetical protein Lal_00005965 [Lupinus albus]
MGRSKANKVDTTGLEERCGHVVDVKRIGNRIIVLKIVAKKDTYNVNRAYAPQTRLEEYHKIFLRENFNGHVGRDCKEYEGLHGVMAYGKQMWKGHLITYKSGVTCSQISFFLIRKSNRKLCMNCKLIPEESLTT